MTRSSVGQGKARKSASKSRAVVGRDTTIAERAQKPTEDRVGWVKGAKMAVANGGPDKPWTQVVLRDECEGCKIPPFPVVQCDRTFRMGVEQGATNKEMEGKYHEGGRDRRRGTRQSIKRKSAKMQEPAAIFEMTKETDNIINRFTYPDGEVERERDRSEIGRCEWKPCSRGQMLNVGPRSHENRP